MRVPIPRNPHRGFTAFHVKMEGYLLHNCFVKSKIQSTYRKKIIVFFTFFIVLIFIAGSFIKNKIIDIKADDKFEESKKLIEPYVEALKAKHPNWTFEYFNTGIEWSEVISGEMKISTSLVPYASDLTYIYQKDEILLFYS